MLNRTEAIVVGAGVAGAMTALELRKRGASVTLIDRWEPGHWRAASTDYNRIIRAISGRDEFYTRWVRDARERWIELQAETGQKLYYENGALILATEGHCDWEDATQDTFRKSACRISGSRPKMYRSTSPNSKTDDIAYALYEPEAGMVMAQRGVQAAVGLFERLGGKVARGRGDDGSQ